MHAPSSMNMMPLHWFQVYTRTSPRYRHSRKSMSERQTPNSNSHQFGPSNSWSLIEAARRGTKVGGARNVSTVKTKPHWWILAEIALDQRATLNNAAGRTNTVTALVALASNGRENCFDPSATNCTTLHHHLDTAPPTLKTPRFARTWMDWLDNQWQCYSQRCSLVKQTRRCVSTWALLEIHDSASWWCVWGGGREGGACRRDRQSGSRTSVVGGSVGDGERFAELSLVGRPGSHMLSRNRSMWVLTESSALV